ncbi:hypothetical protein JP75_07535 [Devosia riboflavina]|uniref:Tyr recombinase domain-containing protein n=1 Tax=Devosia riboflavina TaxID=46914 RepID=A0A087M3F4_9HYPH|nr:tyrosine-type recombinase/integrase [Devosia riboflavina]KFL31407.1 hypothetical protein JP75_07535 [Devosia riboflavina]
MLVKIVGIKQYTDRHGKLRRYYRRKGCPQVAIDPSLTGAQLAAEVARLDALYKPHAMRAGTLRVLIAEYQEKSAHWKGLRERTQKDYQRIFDSLGDVQNHMLDRFKPKVITELRDIASELSGFKHANQLLITLSKVFAYGVEYGHCQSNPVSDISSVARPTDLPDANRPWMPEEAVTILAAPIHLAAPIAMAAYLGLREGDIIKMSKGAITERLLSLTTSKTRRALELPVCDDLWAILKRYNAWREALWEERRRKAAAKNSREDIQDLVMTMFVNTRGKAWTSDGFRTSWGKWRDEVEEAKKVAPGITFHGARHGVATVLAECGYEPQQVKHLLGHGSETMTEHYQRRAKRRGMLKDMTDAVQMAYRNAGQSTVVGLDTFPVRSAENGQG